MRPRIYVVAEGGINANGDLDLARQMIHTAKACGADAIKWQKRTIEAVYTAEELARPRDSVFGTTNGDLKRGLEFGRAEYDAIDAECRRLDLPWTASCWDVESVTFISAYDPPFLKVASACLTDTPLLQAYRATGLPVVLSTGMSTAHEIEDAITTLDLTALTLLHCCAAYPAPIDALNLSALQTLRHYGYPVGYSSHSVSPWPALCAAAMGAVMLEAHLTLDRTLWGSDQAASLEPAAFAKLVTEVRDLERAWGDGVIRCEPCEEPVKAKLRRVHA